MALMSLRSHSHVNASMVLTRADHIDEYVYDVDDGDNDEDLLNRLWINIYF